MYIHRLLGVYHQCNLIQFIYHIYILTFYISIYTYIHIYIYTHDYTYIYTHDYTYTYEYMYVDMLCLNNT